ncbi:MAG: 3-phosphoshikimate 1-carboxyvinyltransferase, partial [Clostridia bacterium]|nr:3-phosphoshikimate 1-carboxyvinyltransferase [Clostridia bacterium]
ALPFTEGGGTLRLLPPVESRSYIDLTLAMLSRFGAPVRTEGDVLHVGAVCALTPADVTVEGDYSNAAFFEALRVLGHDVRVTGLDPESRQGDRVYREYFAALEAGTPTLSLADCPDLGPVLMAVAAARHGAVFTDTARLAIKESDRGAAMAEELSKLGTRVTVEKNRITVEGGTLSSPRAPLCGHNDHRIVMALATLATLVGGCIEGAEAVKKSLPEYFDILTQLGAKVIL